MSSASQVFANHANAQKSTGPQSPEGKAKCAQNARKHGLASTVLHIPQDQQLEFRQFEANLQSAVQPEGALETETCGQLVFAAWRLRQLHQAIAALYHQHQSDPLVTPECAAALRQLSRYRAALEMTFYRAIKQLRELQTRRAGRALQLHPPEQAYYPLQLNPSLYAKARHTRGSRQCNLETVGLLGPLAQWRITLDESHLPITPCERIRPRRE